MTQLLPRILRDLRPYRRSAAGVLACTLLYAAGRIIPPLLARTLLDATLRDRTAHLAGVAIAPPQALVAVPALVLAVAALLGLSQHLMRSWAGALGQRLIGDLQVRLFEHLLRLPAPALERRALGRQMVRFAGDMSAVRQFVSRSLPEIVRDALSIAAIAAALLALNAALALPVAAALALYAAALAAAWRRLQPAARALRGERARISAIALDRLRVARAVKLAGRERTEAGVMRRAQEAVLGAAVRVAGLSGLVAWASELVVGVALAAALGIGAQRVAAGASTHGEMVAFYGLALLLVSPLRTLGRTVESLAKGRVAFERLYEVLDRPVEKGGPRRLRVRRGQVSLRGLRAGSFAFPDLQLEPGVTAVVGGPAGGAAALGQVLVSLRRPEAGRVRIDGADLAGVTLRSLRRAVMYVPYPPHLLKGTLRRNLRPGPGPAGEAPGAALRAVGADWADSLDLRVGSEGRRLSPVQRWQVLCARALLARPAIVVFDGVPFEDGRLDGVLRALRDSGVKTILLLVDRPPQSPAVDRVVALEPAPAHA